MDDQDGGDTIQLPPLTPAVLDACSFQNWYKLFSPHTFRSTIIPLDQSVVDYLRDNSHGLHLPDELTASSAYESQLSSDSDDEAELERSFQLHSSSSRSSTPPPRYSFPELTRKITETIELYDGSSFPKLNWSAPQVGPCRTVDCPTMILQDATKTHLSSYSSTTLFYRSGRRLSTSFRRWSFEM